MKLNTKNLGTGLLYFYVHFVVEVICFFALGRYFESTPIMWLIPFAYDMLAFVPQSIIGYISDKCPKIPFGHIGMGLLFLALILQNTVPIPFVSLVPLCIGNACVHVQGAEVTLRTSNGNLSHSAIFVSGGSFGVVTGKLLSATTMPWWLLLFLIVSAVPFIMLAETYCRGEEYQETSKCKNFKYNNAKIGVGFIIIMSVFVVIVRGYMAYAIPTSWNKTTLQTILLFTFMGTGKALGGILSDLFGIKKVALGSVALALPFLMFGDNRMIVSLIGVMLFSMTMSITLGVLVSVLQGSPGLAFGLTTIGLFMGSVPSMFFRVHGIVANCIMLSVMTVICFVCFMISIRKDAING